MSLNFTYLWFTAVSSVGCCAFPEISFFCIIAGVVRDVPVAGGVCVDILVAFTGDLVKHVSFARSLIVGFLTAGG